MHIKKGRMHDFQSRDSHIIISCTCALSLQVFSCATDEGCGLHRAKEHIDMIDNASILCTNIPKRAPHAQTVSTSTRFTFRT